jgi:hypothetical protein
VRLRRPSTPRLIVLAVLLAIAAILLTRWTVVGHAAAGAAPDARTLAEVNRTLEEEIKLAARPQVYLVLDLFERVVLVKSRGVELHRFPVTEWRGPNPDRVFGVYRLLARPPVTRPKAAPLENPDELAVIEVKDMPDAYELRWEPPLIIAVAPPANDQPWAWAQSWAREWWSRVWGTVRGQDAPGLRRLRLTVEQETARSLAWSVTERMPLLIGRTHAP